MSSKPPEVDIEGDDCYHGEIDKDDLQDILDAYGDYLLRSEVSSTAPASYLLCVYDSIEIKEFQIIIEGSKISLQGGKGKYDNVSALIMDLVGKKTELPDSDLELVRAIKRLPWELSKDQVEISKEKPLGFGQAYTVRKGTMTFNGHKILVALKIMERKDLQFAMETLKEARFMRTIDHPNCITFYGIVMDKEPVMLVTELVNMGDLLSYLKKPKEHCLTTLEKARLAVQAAWGLEYLHARQLTHKRITARKCLLNRLDGAGDKIQLQLAEMDLEDPAVFQGNDTRKALKSLPLRHMSPECLTLGLFNAKTDVWMFGCLLFEIYSDGKTLYDTLKLAQVKECINKGNLQEIPIDFPNHAKEFIKAAWQQNPEDRPEMEKLARAFEKYTKSTAPIFVVRKTLKVDESKKPSAEVLEKNPTKKEKQKDDRDSEVQFSSPPTYQRRPKKKGVNGRLMKP